jgi:hypothetical protein
VKELDGEPMDVKPATEPTNILWENRHITKREKSCRIGAAITVITIILLIAFFLIFICKRYVTPKGKVNVDCKDIANMYSSNSMYKHFALKEYYDTMMKEPATPATGVLQCFCLMYKEEYGATDARDTYFSMDEVKDPQGNVIDKMICKEVIAGNIVETIVNQVISFVIVIVNTVLRMTMIWLINLIGFDTHSSVANATKNAVFVA